MAHTPMLYYVNDKIRANGEYEIHREDCEYLQFVRNKTELGVFDNCQDALEQSKRDHYPRSNGCRYCCINCYTQGPE